jgi:hypothetical protein
MSGYVVNPLTWAYNAGVLDESGSAGAPETTENITPPSAQSFEGMADVTIGDVYKFTFRAQRLSLFSVDLDKKVLDEISKHAQHFEIINCYQVDDKVYAFCKVTDNPLPFLAVFGAVVAGSAILLYMFGIQLEKVEKVIDKPAGAFLTVGVTIIGIIVGIKLLFDW